jgi:hypothetical protein
MTRWQGIKNATGLLPIAVPTALEAFGFPIFSAKCPYVDSFPIGIVKDFPILLTENQFLLNGALSYEASSSLY